MIHNSYLLYNLSSTPSRHILVVSVDLVIIVVVVVILLVVPPREGESVKRCNRTLPDLSLAQQIVHRCEIDCK